MRTHHAVPVLALLCAAGPAHASPRYTLRLATAAPDGTPWARELRAFAREVSAQTRGELEVKWYMGGIAGSELEVEERIRRGQLDATASGGMTCQRVAPIMRVLRIHGLFQSRDEATYVLGRLQEDIASEARGAGYVLLGTSSLGPDVVLSRSPVRSMTELRTLKLWRWDLDDPAVRMSRAMGMAIVPTSLETAARAYQDGTLDGFLAIPSAALAFQWFVSARNLTVLPMGILSACMLVANRWFDRLPLEMQQSLRTTTAKLSVRFNLIGRQTDEQLLGGVFEKQGVRPQPPSEQFRAEFFTAARAARDQLGDQLVPPQVLQRVLSILADYRAEHR